MGPAIRRGDDQAIFEMLLAVFGFEAAARILEERIDRALLEVGFLLVELALDRRPRVVLAAASNQVNADVRAVRVTPIGPTEDLVILRRQQRIRLEEVHHQLLKTDAILGLRLILAELGKGFSKRGHDGNYALLYMKTRQH